VDGMVACYDLLYIAFPGRGVRHGNPAKTFKLIKGEKKSKSVKTVMILMEKRNTEGRRSTKKRRRDKRKGWELRTVYKKTCSLLMDCREEGRSKNASETEILVKTE